MKQKPRKPLKQATVSRAGASTLPPTDRAAGPGSGRSLALAVALSTFLVYLTALRNDFVSLDDYGYVLDNPHIRSLGPEFFRWAFTDLSAGFWHPITWISYAVDYAVWGLNPLGYHLTAIILHGINTYLVTTLAQSLLVAGAARTLPGEPDIPDRTSILIAAAVTGLLFGLHPLHVESVAWVSERKDLLSALFFLLSLKAYVGFGVAAAAVDDGSPPLSPFRDRRYLLALWWFLCALASKTMAVSLPVVLLILDWYPLARIRSARSAVNALLEKIPFIAASLIIAVTSVIAQHSIGALAMMETKPLPVRLFVAAKALVVYLVKMVLPINLVPLYPYPLRLSFLSPEYLVPLAVAVAVTIMAVLAVKRERLWLALWGYYVITLLPALGIVQVGIHSMADRFTYLPSLAPFLLVGLAAARLRTAGETVQRVVVPLGIALVVVLSLLTTHQIGIWRSSLDLWDHTIKSGPKNNSTAYNSRGLMYKDAGQIDLAIADYTTAVTLEPSEAAYYVNRAVAFSEKGDPDRALADLNTALSLKPTEYMAYNNRGNVWYAKGEYDRALADFDRAIALKPSNPLAYRNRGAVYEKKGDPERAARDSREADRLEGSGTGTGMVRETTSPGLPTGPGSIPQRR